MTILPSSDDLTILGVWERGVPNRERIVAVATGPVNLGQRALVQTARGEGGFTLLSVPYLLPAIVLAPGTYAVIYTGPGTPMWTQMMETGEPAYVVHLGCKHVLFARPDLQPLVLHVASAAFPP